MEPDRELANRVVAILTEGMAVTVTTEPDENAFYVIPGGDDLQADDFVSDWRVAGKLMERCAVVHTERENNHAFTAIANFTGKLNEHSETRDNLLARAVIKACVEVLERGQ
jgi:hypothetical protein